MAAISSSSMEVLQVTDSPLWSHLRPILRSRSRVKCQGQHLSPQQHCHDNFQLLFCTHNPTYFTNNHLSTYIDSNVSLAYSSKTVTQYALNGEAPLASAVSILPLLANDDACFGL